MRADSLHRRLQRLEISQVGMDTRNLILSSCPMLAEAATVAAIEQWLDGGLAHIAFKGRHSLRWRRNGPAH
jgi:hypothetical protein